MAAGDLSLNIIIGAAMGGTFGATIGAIQSALSALGRGDYFTALGDAAAGLGASMVTAAQKAGDFQQQITMLSTSAGESANNLKTIGDGILKISEDTGTSTQQLTSAMYYVESSGQRAGNAIKELTVAAEGAKTENADLTTVTNALITVMQDYHLPVEDSTAAMNGLIATVQNGRTNLQTLSSALGQVLPTAASLGVAFPQVAAAMDVMTNAGVNSRMAAMELAHFFLALEAPSNKAQDAMTAVGLTAQQLKDTLISKGLPEALQMIEDHIGKKFPAGSTQAVEALKDITGGLMGFKVNASLTGDELPILSDDIKKITKDMNSGKDSVMGWDQVQQNFNTRLDQMHAAFEAMMITVGQQLLPIFGQMVQWVTNIIEKFTAWEEQTHFVENALNALVTAVNTLATWLQQAYSYVDGFVSAFAPLFDQLVKNATTWGNNFMVGFLNGMIPIINQIISTVEQVAQEIENYLGFHSPTKKGPGSTLNEWGVGMMKGLAQGIIDAIPAVSDAVNKAATELQTISTKGATSLQAAGAASTTFSDTGGSGDTMKATVTPAKALPMMAQQMQSTGTSSADALTKALSTGVKQGVGSVQTAVNSVAATTDTACKAAEATSKCVSDHLTKGTAAKTTAGTSAVKEAAKKVGDATNPAADAALKAAEAAHKALTTQLAKKVQGSAPAVQGAASNLADMIKKPVETIPPVVDKAGQSGQKLGPAFSSGAKAGQSALQAFVTWVQQALGNIGKWFQQAAADFEPVIQAAKRFLDALKTLYTEVIQPIVVGIGDLAKGFGIFVQNIAKSVQETGAFNATGQVFAKLIAVIMDVVSGLVKGLSISLGPAIKAIATVVTTQIAPAFGHLLQSMVPMIPAIQALGAIIVGGLVVAIGILAGFVVGLVTGLANLLSGITQTVGGIIQVISGVAQLINGILDMIVGLFTNNQQDIQEGQKAFSQGIQDIWSGLGNSIMGIVNGIYGFVTGIFSGLANTVGSIFTNLNDELVGHSIIPDMANAIENVFSNLADWIVNSLTKTVQDFITYWTQVGQEMQKLAQAAWAYVQAIFQQAWNKYIQPGLSAIATGFTNWWKTETAAVQKLAQDLWKAVSDIFTGSWTQLAADLATLAKDFQTWFTNLSTQFGTWATNLMKMFGQGIQSGITQFLQPAINAAAQAITNVLGIFSPAKTGPLSTANQWMPNLMNMLASGIKSGTPAVTGGVNNMAVGVGNSMSNMTSNVGNSANQMKESLQSVGNDISNMQSRVSAAINQAKADMQSATAEIQGNLTAEKSLITQTIGYLTNQMQQMGKLIQATENQAGQATASVTNDLKTTNATGQAIQVDLDLSNKATASAWQNQLNAVKAAQSSMNAQGMSTKAQADALQKATQAGNDAYLATLAQTHSQSAALKAETNAFNASISQSKSAAADQKSMQNAAQSSTSAQSSQTAANASQTSSAASKVNAQMSIFQAGVAVLGADSASQQAHVSALNAGFSWNSADQAGDAMAKAAWSATQSMTNAHMSASQEYAALQSANKAYSDAYTANVSKTHSQSAAEQAGMNAFQSSIKASEAASNKQNAQSSSNSAQTYALGSSGYAQQAASAAKSSKEGATTSQTYQVVATASVKTITQDNKQSTGFVESLKADLAQASAMAAQIGQLAAQAMASRLAMFSPAKEGPLSTADKWIPNMLKMFIQGLVQEAPALKNATKITAKGVKDAFNEAAIEAGATLIKLKQKSDDIYATIQQSISTGGTTGTPGKVYSADIFGDIPIQGLGTPGTAGTTSTQEYTIHLDLDGKTIAKTVMQYQQKELRVQGVVRSK